MKKVLFVLALVMAYGLSVSTASAKMVIVDDAGVTVVAEDNQKAPEGDKVAAKAKSAACGDKTSATATVTNTAAKSAACGDSPVKAVSTASVKSAACGDQAAKTTAVAEVVEEK